MGGDRSARVPECSVVWRLVWLPDVADWSGRKLAKGPRFAKASYAMFAVAVMMAALKLGGFLDAEPLFLKTVPADQVAKTSDPEIRRQTEEREASDPQRRLKILRLVRSTVRSSEA